VPTPEIHSDVLAVMSRARLRFESWAGMDAPHLPEDAMDAMQVRLARWQIAKFGLCDQAQQTLGIIEELGETHSADTVEEAIDGLGDVLVFCGQLCITARLALGPILDLAERWYRTPANVPGTVMPSADTAGGFLAHVVLKRQQRIRGYEDDTFFRCELTRALALVIVRAVDNVVINQMVDGGWDAIEPPLVYRATGDFVIDRSNRDATVTTLGVDGIEAPVAEIIEERHLDGTEQEISDAEIVTDLDALRAAVVEVAARHGLREATPEEVEVLRAAAAPPANHSDTPTVEITAEELEEALRAEPEAP
jgi:hypothetical protein